MLASPQPHLCSLSCLKAAYILTPYLQIQTAQGKYVRLPVLGPNSEAKRCLLLTVGMANYLRDAVSVRTQKISLR
jgi:hypothetical protein